MTAIRVNIDYESELFHGNGGGPGFNQTLEFFGFFLDERPVYTTKQYSADYLSYVHSVTGQMPQTISSGDYLNWWGALKDRELEKKLNSKMTSTELVIQNKWCEETYLLKTIKDFPSLEKDKSYIAKSPYEMSGRSFRLIDPLKTEENFLWAEKALQKSPLIIEPFFNRKWDFSHYVFPDGKVICYENKVDEKFQYKGSVFHNEAQSVENLSSYASLEKSEWDKFQNALQVIIAHYKNSKMNSGFSIDSFVYEEDGKLKIRFLSEVNYRRTMGQTAFELGERYGKEFSWRALFITKSFGDFLKLQKTLSSLENILILSPGDTRFDLFFLKAKNIEEARVLVKSLSSLLPSGQFPVEF